MTSHLLIFTIGPVQSFISQARKTQDLFSGSRMLSSLTRKAFERLEAKTGKHNLELIFPSFFDEEGAPVSANPNRFAIRVSKVDSALLKSYCEHVKKEVIQEDFVKSALEALEMIPGSMQVMKEMKEQLSSHLEIFWAAIPISGNDYATEYAALESTLGGIKNVRPFAQLSEKGRKCNVDGIQNALFVRHVQDEFGVENPHPPAFVQQPYCKVPATDTRLEQGEGLSAVSAYKRLFEKTENFPSTARIALLHMLDRISKNPEQVQALEQYHKLLPGNWDEQLLFEENLTPKYFRKHEQIINLSNGAVKPEILAQYKLLKEKVGTFGPNYYALLVFDGDRMGEWISGRFLEDKKHLPIFQSVLKDLLRDFAIWAIRFLDEPKGKTIYAGGDDFLGFVNLHYLFESLTKLRAEFFRSVNKPLKDETVRFSVKPAENFSFSAGIAIAHYKEPLGLVLEEARNAEKAAKAQGADHLAISVMRHSGGVTRCVSPFEVSGSSHIEVMRSIVDGLSGEHFSNRFINELVEVTNYWEGASPRELFDVEVARLIKRAKMNKEASLNSMVAPLEILSDKNNKDITDLSVDKLRSIVNSLLVCDFIYRATKNNSDDNL
jgi:CRISPR-associated protein Cmr2